MRVVDLQNQYLIFTVNGFPWKPYIVGLGLHVSPHVWSSLRQCECFSSSGPQNFHPSNTLETSDAHVVHYNENRRSGSGSNGHDSPLTSMCLLTLDTLSSIDLDREWMARSYSHHWISDFYRILLTLIQRPRLNYGVILWL
jgi:hypothetical protein